MITGRTINKDVEITLYGVRYLVSLGTQVEDLGHYADRPGPFLHTEANEVRVWDEVAGHYTTTAPVSTWHRVRAVNVAKRTVAA